MATTTCTKCEKEMPELSKITSIVNNVDGARCSQCCKQFCHECAFSLWIIPLDFHYLEVLCERCYNWRKEFQSSSE